MKDEQLAGLERLAKYQARMDSKIVPIVAETILQFVEDYRAMRQRAEAAEVERDALCKQVEAQAEVIRNLRNLTAV